jgi:hypothetical protein
MLYRNAGVLSSLSPAVTLVILPVVAMVAMVALVAPAVPAAVPAVVVAVGLGGRRRRDGRRVLVLRLTRRRPTVVIRPASVFLRVPVYRCNGRRRRNLVALAMPAVGQDVRCRRSGRRGRSCLGRSCRSCRSQGLRYTCGRPRLRRRSVRTSPGVPAVDEPGLAPRVGHSPSHDRLRGRSGWSDHRRGRTARRSDVLRRDVLLDSGL